MLSATALGAAGVVGLTIAWADQRTKHAATPDATALLGDWLVAQRSIHATRLLPVLIWRTVPIAQAVLALFAVVLVAAALFGFTTSWTTLCLAIAWGGACSNVADLQRHGFVVNTVVWRRYLAFNLADAAITAGLIGAALIQLLRWTA